MKPIWLLDIDGVLNAARPGWDAPPYSAWVSDWDNFRWRIRWSPACIKRIQLLWQSGNVDIQWCTTWCCRDDISKLEATWGLPRLPRAIRPLPSDTSTTIFAQKVAAANAVIASGIPLIWTDDDISPSLIDSELNEWDHLLIAPRPSRGLRPHDLDLIETFIATHAGDSI